MVDPRRIPGQKKPLRRKTWLRRSAKPIRKLGRHGKLRKKGMDAARKIYGDGSCQLCKRIAYVGICFHHKFKRSEGGTENPENLVALCWGLSDTCHELVHADRELFNRVKASPADILNKEFI